MNMNRSPQFLVQNPSEVSGSFEKTWERELDSAGLNSAFSQKTNNYLHPLFG